MIEANRLEKLIEQDATIYYADKEANIPIPIFLNKKNLDKKEESCGGGVISTEDLYETYKDAERALKHHATRIEKLDLPTWEEFCKHKYVSFNDEFCNHYELELNKNSKLIITKYPADWEIFYEPATEENYEKACDLCVKLFKGE